MPEVLIVNQREVPQLLPMAECIEAMAGALAALARRPGDHAAAADRLDPGSHRGAGPHAVAVGGAGGDGGEGRDLLSPQRGHRARFAPGRRPALRGGARPAARHHRRDVDHRDPHRGGLRRRHAPAGARGRRRSWPSSGPASRRARTSRPCGSRARSGACASRARRSSGPAPSRGGSPRGTESPITACESVQEAVDGADIVCTVTSSRVPVLRGEWLTPGTHVNAVGSSVASARELDTAAVVRSRLFVDRRESALAEAGDFLIPRDEGAVTDAHIVAEIGELEIGAAPAGRLPRRSRSSSPSGSRSRTSPPRSASIRGARESGIGTFVDFGGGRDEAD